MTRQAPCFPLGPLRGICHLRTSDTIMFFGSLIITVVPGCNPTGLMQPPLHPASGIVSAEDLLGEGDISALTLDKAQADSMGLLVSMPAILAQIQAGLCWAFKPRRGIECGCGWSHHPCLLLALNHPLPVLPLPCYSLPHPIPPVHPPVAQQRPHLLWQAQASECQCQAGTGLVTSAMDFHTATACHDPSVAVHVPVLLVLSSIRLVSAGSHWAGAFFPV